MAETNFDYEKTTPSNVYTCTIDGSIDAAWALVRSFGTWNVWTKVFADVHLIGDGVDKIGCIREFSTCTLNKTYQEQLNAQDEQTRTLKYEMISIVPPLEGLVDVFINVSLTPKSENQFEVSETAWNVYDDKATPEFKAELKEIQNNGAKCTYGDLATYLAQQSKQQADASN